MSPQSTAIIVDPRAFCNKAEDAALSSVFSLEGRFFWWRRRGHPATAMRKNVSASRVAGCCYWTFLISIAISAKNSCASSPSSSCDQPTNKWQPLGAVVSISGVGFFDIPHTQKPHGENFAELHPVTGIKFTAVVGGSMGFVGAIILTVVA